MIVAFDANRDRDAVTGVDDAGVLSGTNQDVRGFGG
jgi:hypothetical protein